MGKTYEEFPSLAVDKYRLDIEWEGQPELYRKWASYLGERQADADTWKDHCEQLRSRVDATIREDLSARGEKFTEAKITGMVAQNLEYVEALRTLRISQAEIGQLKALVTALEQRKSALENLTRLYGMEYFAKPNIPAVGQEIAANNKIHRSINGGE